MRNTLYFGDNLSVLGEHVPDESVDLIYLDPPFNSNATYNVLFREKTGEESPAQVRAFVDAWEWTHEAEYVYRHGIIENPHIPASVVAMVSAFRDFVGRNDMMAYLVMMAPRLVELKRVLKPTGSIYLHCDPTASHYLKLLMDAVFGKDRFRSEITWRRTNAKGLASRRYANNADRLLYYTKGDRFTWNSPFRPHETGYVEKFYRHLEPETGRRYQLADLVNPNRNRPNLTYEFLGVTRVWRWTRERMQAAYDEGLIVQSSPNSVPRLKRYLDEMQGTPVDTIWEDIPPIQANSPERLGYPTQKPIALLERIIAAGSNEGDVILDPFCGCGTAVAAAQKLNRQWVGIDITHLAVALMKNRIKTAYDLDPGRDYDVVGEPEDEGSARALWAQDPYQFQFWAISLLEARPIEESRRGADRGVDGLLHFIDGPRSGTQKIVVQVKGGQVSVPQIRDLRGVVEREQAAMGLFISLEPPTAPMRTEAAAAGHFHSTLWDRDYAKVQIRTIAQLLAGRGFDLPPSVSRAYQDAQRVRRGEGRQAALGEAET